MSLLVDTRAVPPRERFDYWLAASTEIFMPFGIHRRTQQPFSGRISGHQLGHVGVFRTAGDPTLVHRTRASIGASDPECLSVGVHLRGRCSVRQLDHRTALRPGDITSIDSSRPFTIETHDPYEWLVFTVPKFLLHPFAEEICRQTATRIPSSEGLGKLVSPFLLQLGRSLESGAVPEDEVSVAESVLALIRALYTHRSMPGDALQVGSGALRVRIKQYIEANLNDPALSPDRIARAHFISTRQLNRLFEAEGQSVCESIRLQRLDRCRRDLTNPSLGSEAVFSIARRWGFRSQAHFSRLFRATYGASPSEYRHENGVARNTSREPRLLAARV
jgi:AraC-like DNA-binding protein